jgi:LDH2 family malate/lactate/ureidoglycolate dehydrogenase
MPAEKKRYSPKDLTTLVHGIFRANDVSDEHARTVADVLVWANVRGIDSHGVSRVPRYLELFEKGQAKARPEMVTERPAAAVVTVDADGAPGPVALDHAMRQAIEVARETGVAWAGVRGTVHTGAVGYYASQAAEAGMIGIGLVAGVPNMAYTGTSVAGVATSPLTIAVPAGRHPTALLDMATATIALGKIAQYKINGLPLPEGAALTKAGEPTTDPAEAAIPTPMAGAKGAGMSLMFELLTSVLLNNPIVSEFHGGTTEGRRHRQNAALIAVDVEAFGPRQRFLDAVDDTLDAVLGLPSADDSPVAYPGQRSAATEEERTARGVPVAGKTWQALVEAAERYGLPLPDALP